MRELYEFGPYHLDPEHRTVWRGEQVISITGREFDVLFALLRGAGVPVDKYALLREIWPENAFINENNLSQQIRALRRKLGRDAAGQEYIRNISNQGYFIPGVLKVVEEALPEGETNIENRSDLRGEGEMPAGIQPPPRSGFVLPTRAFIAVIIAILLIVFGMAARIGAYGLAIVLVSASCLLASVVYIKSEDTPFNRGVLAVLFTAVMAYIPSAGSLADVMTSVINGTTLRPAIAYPFITGLKFIPLYVLVLAYWVLLGRRENSGFRSNPALRYIYIFSGAIFLLLTAVLLVRSSGEDRIWREALPGYRLILVGYFAVVIINIAVWSVGYREFDRAKVTSYHQILLVCAVGYLPLAFAGLLIDQTYNAINIHYLDKRRPEVYSAAHPEALERFRNVRSDIESDIGPDLRNLVDDPAFERALRTKDFYKQNFDELFQIGNRSVMFGYRTDSGPSQKTPPRFTIIRFPEKMTAALGFHIVSE
jgi:DNA-binding winged helix-turn-helix (wHTH) protein